MAHRKTQKHIEIVRSSNAWLSSMSEKSCAALYSLLTEHYTTVGVSTVNTVSDLEQVVIKQPDLVFMGMKYVPGALPGQKVWVSEYLEQHHITHTGSPKNAIELEQNKSLAKQRVAAAGIKTAQHVVVKSGETFTAANSTLRFPLFVKPTDLGGGVGVDTHSVVHDQKELDAKLVSLAAKYNTDALVEEFLSGREYSVAVLRDEFSEDLVAMPLELVAGPDVNGYRILSHELKSAPLETPVFPVTDVVVREALIELAVQVFIAIGARDYGRIDIRMDKTGTPHFLEANLIPCLIRGSGNFPKACVMNLNMDYEAMILRIVRLGLARAEEPVEEVDDVVATFGSIIAPAIA